MAEVTHELRHKGACQLKGDESEGQREDIQRCKTVWCYTWFIMGSLSHWQGPECHEQSGRMEVGEMWEELKLGGIIAMIKTQTVGCCWVKYDLPYAAYFTKKVFRIAEFWAHPRLPELPYAFSDTQQFTGLAESQWELKVCFSACSLDTGSSVFSLGLLPQTSCEWIYLQWHESKFPVGENRHIKSLTCL